MVVVKSECAILLDHGPLKYAASQEKIDVKSWFFACWYKFKKAENCFNNYWAGMVKNGWDLLDHETLKLGVLQNDFMN